MSVATLPPARVPTLTEVVDWSPGLLTDVPSASTLPETAPSAAFVDPATPWLAEADAPVAVAVDAVDAAPLAPPIDEAALTQRILADLQRQVDLMLDHHLRVAMAPALNRLSQSLAESARDELASTLRDMVARAVSQELMRQRTVSNGNDPG